MAFNIIESSKAIVEKYQRYLKTIFDIKDEDYKGIFLEKLKDTNPFSKGPFLDVTNSFEKGSPVKNLIEDNVISKDFEKIPSIYNKTLHKHQEKSLRKIINGRNLVVSTGTGSGKTESFLVPILNNLMREKEEKGKITPGVRALIIYPMNALANDQIERLREYLVEYPDITFGCYTGQTKDKESDALILYRELNKDDSKFKEPIKNELISRDKMKESPPNILITNYAMLEYLMLRPDDSVFFDGEFAQDWKFIVLDEAHTYVGSTGIEVSMLMRRLLAKLNNPSIQYILTSATLGSENTNDKVVEFASKLCNAHFEESDVVRADRVDLTKLKDNKFTLESEFYNYVSGLLDEGYDDNYVLSKINDKYNFSLDNSNLDEFLYDLLLTDKTYWKVKDFLDKAKSVEEICEYMNWNSTELSNFVNVASRASKERTKLFDSRYHLFIRATDGVFITLSPHKNLFLDRKNYHFYNGEKYKVFEAVTCQQCHSLYIMGKIEDNYLVQESNVGLQEIKSAFYIGDQISDSDEDNLLEDEKLKTEMYELCPHCGYIRKANAVKKDKCEHNDKEYVKLIKVETSERTGRVTKCICCESVKKVGILRAFFTGQEASTSVIGTALFEELPDAIIHKSIVSEETENDGFDDGFDVKNTEKVITEYKPKQFIAFSDSRQAAAYFSTYFSDTYNDLLYSKIVNDLIKKKKGISKPLANFVEDLAATLESEKVIYKEKNSKIDYVKEAWKIILKILVDNKSRNSLIGLGLLSIDFDDMKWMGNTKYKLSEDEVKTLCLVFAMGMCSEAAFYYNEQMTENDRSYFTHSGNLSYYLLEGSNSKYKKTFLPKSKSNKRMEYLERVISAKKVECSREDIKNFLKSIWNRFFVSSGNNKNEISEEKKCILSFNEKENAFLVDTNQLTIGNDRKWYRCSKCKKYTTYNIENVCPTYKCDGKLEEVEVDELEKNNHYYRTFNDLKITPLKIVEHTAQLDRNSANEYQKDFKNKKINALSCSTTFEMGVDVGELETVFMRNMPPAPSNYTQRAGRAGRSSKSAAFALTFCNKSNHDFNYFKDPVSMISGLINPPTFKIENEKICIRHLYSAAFAFFWKKHKEYFSDVSTMLGGVISANNKTGYEEFKDYLYSKPEDLKKYIKAFLPSELYSKFEVETFGWVDWLFDDPQDNYPNFKTAYEVYNDEINTLIDEKSIKDSENLKSDYIKKIINTFEKESIITFLSKNGVLPKYGFPVDTIKLETIDQNNNKVEISRDLSMAIAEYAPGCEVVVDGKLITSRYIKKAPNKGWKKYDFKYCPNCKSLNVAVHSEVNENLKECQNQKCKAELKGNKKSFIIPEFGFKADRKIEKPTLIKPERTFRTEASYITRGENNSIEEEYKYNNLRVNVSSITNGYMAILTSDDFYVCETCGYAKEVKELEENSKSKNKDNSALYFINSINEKHKNIEGNICSCERLKKLSLGYHFETDVVKIRFEKMTGSMEEAQSILQALIIAASRVLDIDNNEIAGCLQYYNLNRYNYILYDRTPGGAGHVKRLCNKDTMLEIIKEAYRLSSECSCGDSEGDSSCYNCLRTYQNQKHHDKLKRSYVTKYFNNIL
ncbi:MAG: DEAD/DEAH box helicase [Clostridia bacterium]|nr:DEAD/DEAH box helicase [Clostridia bacterium]